jgi:GT2 family glycosyltransferase
MRFRLAGWKILFVPDVEVVHYRGTCSKSRPVFVLWHKHKGMIRFYRKFFRHQYPWPLMPLVAAAVWTRFLLLAGMALFLSQKSREATGGNQEQVDFMGTAAQEKRITQPGAEPQTDSTEVDPMLVIASTEAEHTHSRLS